MAPDIRINSAINEFAHAISTRLGWLNLKEDMEAFHFSMAQLNDVVKASGEVSAYSAIRHLQLWFD